MNPRREFDGSPGGYNTASYSVPHKPCLVNNPVSAQEKIVLYRKMLYGKDFRNRYPFLDSRHKIIFENLDYLQSQLFMPGTEMLIKYLREYGMLEPSGGERYVRGIFQGLESELI
jgi:hypothetical protein